MFVSNMLKRLITQKTQNREHCRDNTHKLMFAVQEELFQKTAFLTSYVSSDVFTTLVAINRVSSRMWKGFSIAWTTTCDWFKPLSIIKAYEDKKGKCGSKDRADASSFLSNGEIFSLRTSLCAGLEQFCCSPSADLACICDSRPDNKCNVFK